MTRNPDIAARKLRHLQLATSDDAVGPGARWDEVHLAACSVPDLSMSDVDLRTALLGHELQAPVLIAGMTGGHPDATVINRRLGEAAERLGLGVGVGSQRAGLRDPSLASSYEAVREGGPGAFVLANIGAAQLVDQHDAAALRPADIQRAIDMVDAQALAIHFNVLEEHVQPEGSPNASGWLAAVRRVAQESPIPVVAKETGCGITRETCERLVEAGVAAIDVGGAGGTSFARIEGIRAREAGDARRARLGATFADWGIPTPAAILEARHCGVPVIATGGVLTGLDAAKALALGADCVGLGRVAMMAAAVGLDALLDELEGFLDELRLALLLAGARTPTEMRRSPPVLTGMVESWHNQRTG